MTNTKDFDWEEIDVGAVLKWLKKLDNLHSDGAKVLHVRFLLESQRQQLLKAVEEMKMNLIEDGYESEFEGEVLVTELAKAHDKALCKVIDLLKAKDYMGGDL